MQQAIRQQAVVQPGGVIEVRSSELSAGDVVEVIVLMDTPVTPKRSLTEFFGAAKGSFATPEEADAFIRAERDAWER
jgi:hypothetical protein